MSDPLEVDFEYAGGLNPACEPQMLLHAPKIAAYVSPVCVVSTQMVSSARAWHCSFVVPFVSAQSLTLQQCPVKPAHSALCTSLDGAHCRARRRTPLHPGTPSCPPSPKDRQWAPSVRACSSCRAPLLPSCRTTSGKHHCSCGHEGCCLWQCPADPAKGMAAL